MILEDLKGLGPKRIAALHAANIHSLRDVLYSFPYRYKDTSKVSSIASLVAGDTAVIECHVEKKSTQYYNGISRTIAYMSDLSGSIKCIWYNAPWVRSRLQDGQKFLLYGKVYLQSNALYLNNPSFEEKKGIVPVYKKIPQISNALLQKLVLQILETYAIEEEDFLPSELLQRFNLLSLKEAVLYKHFPPNFELLTKASQRLLINNIIIYLMSLNKFKKHSLQGISLKSGGFDPEQYWQNYSFLPTEDQKKVLLEILHDLQSEQPMMRLVQGDVGSGKTAVAFGAALYTLLCGYQCAFMAPTEVLARQLFLGAQKLFEKYGYKVDLLTSKRKAKEKREVQQGIQDGSIHMVVGTHALFSEEASYYNLGLIITDEQHRFGVAQRKSLQNKNHTQQEVNVLVMSATPIPRSTALILLSDLDISVIAQMPEGRVPVQTAIVPEHKRSAMYDFIKQQLAAGKQAFIICKHVENKDDESDILDVKSHFKELMRNEFAGSRLGLLHGKQKQEEKEETIRQFAEKELDILVATTVVEVGINIPNANVIVIENADLYGLAQLHQLRGRVGRDGSKAWCFLMAKSNDRLKKFTETNDGFEISKIDFFTRGPGEILGLSQHGESALSTLLLQDSAENIIEVCKQIYESLTQEAENAQYVARLQAESDKQIALLEQKITFA
mgnify:CR=1 FL=1